MYSAELLKLRTTRAPWIVAAVAIVGMVLTQVLTIALPRTLRILEELDTTSAGGSGLAGGMPDLAALTDLGTASAQRGLLDLLGNGPGGSGSTGVTALCLLLLGALAATTDFRTGGIVTTALVVPSRTRILAGKAGATATAALAIGAALAVVTALGLVVAVATTPGAHLALSAGEALGVWGRGLVVMVLLAWLGLAVGVLVRGQVAAVVIVGALALVEPMLQAATLVLTGDASAFTSWLPLTLASLASVGRGAAELFGGTSAMGTAAALAGLIAWAVVLLGSAAVVFRRRDLA